MAGEPMMHHCCCYAGEWLQRLEGGDSNTLLGETPEIGKAGEEESNWHIVRYLDGRERGLE